MSSKAQDLSVASSRFLQFVELEQGRSVNTVTAYRKDLATFINYASEVGCTALDEVGIFELRGWLAQQ